MSGQLVSPSAPVFAELTPGDPLPRFVQHPHGVKRFAWDALAGRYLLVCAFMTTADPEGRSAAEALAREAKRFDDRFATALAVTVDPYEQALAGCGDGVKVLNDLDGLMCSVLGVIPSDRRTRGLLQYTRRGWILIDPTLHVLAKVPFEDGDDEHRAIFRIMDALPPPERYGNMTLPVPALVLPNVLGPALCAELAALVEAKAAVEAEAAEPGAKPRLDCPVTDPVLVKATADRLFRCISPEVRKLYAMNLIHLERLMVACHRPGDEGHDIPHRDNTAPQTIHRRFTVSICLNDDYEGGELFFPEYGGASLRAPAGWAVVFPSGLQHGVRAVTSGRRCALQPFMFDEAGEALKAANAARKA